MERLTAIVAAMPEELAPLTGAVRSRRSSRLSFGRAHRGVVEGKQIVLASTGEGRERALRGARELLAAYPAELLIVVGTSGGLSPRLEPGALVVGSRIQDGAGSEFRSDAAWVARALSLGEAVDGTILCSDRLLCSAGEKRAAADSMKTGGPAVVDLESAAFAAAATERGVPCLILRAVCDPADESLPFDINRCRRADGGIDRLAVVRQALFSPPAMRRLWNLRKRVALGSRRMADFVLRLIAEEPRVER